MGSAPLSSSFPEDFRRWCARRTAGAPHSLLVKVSTVWMNRVAAAVVLLHVGAGEARERVQHHEGIRPPLFDRGLQELPKLRGAGGLW